MPELNRDITAFHQHGYVVLDNLLGSDFAAELYAASDDVPKVVWNEARSTANERVLLHDARFRRIFTETSFIDRLTDIVGDDLLIEFRIVIARPLLKRALRESRAVSRLAHAVKPLLAQLRPIRIRRLAGLGAEIFPQREILLARLYVM